MEKKTLIKQIFLDLTKDFKNDHSAKFKPKYSKVNSAVHINWLISSQQVVCGQNMASVWAP